MSIKIRQDNGSELPVSFDTIEKYQNSLATEKQLKKATLELNNKEIDLKERWAINNFLYQLSKQPNSKQIFVDLISEIINSEAEGIVSYLEKLGYKKEIK